MAADWNHHPHRGYPNLLETLIQNLEEPYDELAKLCSDARTKKVGVFVWKRWSDVEDPASDYAQLRKWLDGVAAAGVVGIKMDFFDAEDFVKRRGEEAVLREAARRRLLVNFHGCPKPTGEARTYPNEVTREGVRGFELNFIIREGFLPPQHNAALPFTRFVLGHGDYTPITFQPGHLGETTIAHQWFVGALNGGGAGTHILDLGFLGQEVHQALILSDGAESNLVVKATRQQVKRSDSLDLKLAAGGGFVAVFAPQSSSRSSKD